MTNNQTQQQTPPKPPPPPAASVAHIPTRAALCAVVPGLGAVYNREYMKAVVYFSIFACLVIISESEGIFGIAAGSFYFFTIIDAYRTADGIMKQGGFEAVQYKQESINLPVWGGILILLGVLFLLDNLGAIRIRTAVQFWPLILVALGLYLIVTFFKKNQSERPPETGNYGYRQPEARPGDSVGPMSRYEEEPRGSAPDPDRQRMPEQGDQ